ncbi:MAG TPA: hypothetical protein PK819_14580, partial [Thermomicrobiales bacterium]|nr:hypothetical protein [Thermomicrobiales bacterium]
QLRADSNRRQPGAGQLSRLIVSFHQGQVRGPEQPKLNRPFHVCSRQANVAKAERQPPAGTYNRQTVQ